MDIPDASIMGAVATLFGFICKHLKKESIECKKDRKEQGEKITVLTSIVAVLADRNGVEIDFTKTPPLSDMDANGRAMRQLRKIQHAAPTDKIELKPRARTQRARLSDLDSPAEA